VVGLGGGREKKVIRSDYAVGVSIHHRVGDRIEAGQPLFTVHANDKIYMAQACLKLLEAHSIQEAPAERCHCFMGLSSNCNFRKEKSGLLTLSLIKLWISGVCFKVVHNSLMWINFLPHQAVKKIDFLNNPLRLCTF